MNIKKITSYIPDQDLVILTVKNKVYTNTRFSADEIEFIKKEIERKENLIVINRFTHWILVQLTEGSGSINVQKETLRKAGHTLCQFIQNKKITHITLDDELPDGSLTLAFLEGLALSNYQFLKYQKNAGEKQTSLSAISLLSDHVTAADLQNLDSLIEAVYFARDLINEPASVLTSVKLSQEITDMSKKAGFKAEVFDKQKIKDLKMGGILAVNQGSSQPPTFT